MRGRKPLTEGDARKRTDRRRNTEAARRYRARLREEEAPIRPIGGSPWRYLARDLPSEIFPGEERFTVLLRSGRVETLDLDQVEGAQGWADTIIYWRPVPRPPRGFVPLPRVRLQNEKAEDQPPGTR